MINPFESSVKPANTQGGEPKAPAGNQNPLDIKEIFDQEDSDVDDGDKSKDKKPEKKETDDKEDIDDDGSDDTKKKDDDDEDDKDDDEKDELELKDDDEDKDEDEEKLDLKAKDEEEVKVPPKKKEILAKYPKFFEDFPAIEKMIYRDKQMMELFGTFDNAKEIASRQEQFSAFESQLLSGSTEEILKVVKDTDPKAYDKIIDNYLTVLEKTDKDAFRDVTGNYFKRVIMGMVAEANENQDKELHESAKQLYKYLFNSTKWEDPKNRVEAKDDDATKELKAKEEAFNTKQLRTHASTLQTRVDNVLRSTISDNIDPNGLMSNFEKKKAVEDCLSQLHDRLGRDKNLVGNLSKLWKAAQASDYSGSSLDSIRKTYLGKSRIELTGIIKSVRNEVLKDKPKRSSSKKDDEVEETAPRQGKTTVGRPSQQKPKANERQKGESVEDFFARD